MKEDLTTVGFDELISPEDVDEAVKSEGTTLVVVNSVCGCAAGNARPAVKASINHEKLPNKLTTVFAGVDKEATDRARQYMAPYPPSSPSIALFKDGELVHFIERHQIEGRPVEMIANNLKHAYESFC
jgi:putative YphP/YqiW family bacilliredoxin